jgi:hypothetical protein
VMLYMSMATLAFLLPEARGETAEDLCYVCGLKFHSGVGAHGGRRSSLTMRRKRHEQQHYVTRVCGCLKCFPHDDQLRIHRKTECEMKKAFTKKSDGTNKYPPAYLCDRDGFTALKLELASKSLLPPGASDISCPDDNQLGMINSGRKLVKCKKRSHVDATIAGLTYEPKVSPTGERYRIGRKRLRAKYIAHKPLSVACKQISMADPPSPSSYHSSSSSDENALV